MGLVDPDFVPLTEAQMREQLDTCLRYFASEDVMTSDSGVQLGRNGPFIPIRIPMRQLCELALKGLNEEWIDCKERLPTSGDEVLGWITSGTLHQGEDYFDSALYLNGIWRVNVGDEGDEPVMVSHWKPRPKGPRK